MSNFKNCHACLESINAQASKCRYCGSTQAGPPTTYKLDRDAVLARERAAAKERIKARLDDLTYVPPNVRKGMHFVRFIQRHPIIENLLCLSATALLAYIIFDVVRTVVTNSHIFSPDGNPMIVTGISIGAAVVSAHWAHKLFTFLYAELEIITEEFLLGERDFHISFGKKIDTSKRKLEEIEEKRIAADKAKRFEEEMAERRLKFSLEVPPPKTEIHEEKKEKAPYDPFKDIDLSKLSRNQEN